MIRLLRGQVVIRETPRIRSALWTPEENERKVKWHRGIVLAFGPPALIYDRHEVPHGFQVGDEVIFTFIHNRDAFTNEWSDGKPAIWCPQQCVHAVIEPERVLN